MFRQAYAAPDGDPDKLLVGPELYRLDTEATLPADMVRVPGWKLPRSRA